MTTFVDADASTGVDDVVAALVRSRQQLEMGKLDYQRALKRAKGVMTQVQIGQVIGMSQPGVAQALKTAQNTPEPLEGFSGATVMEVCQRFAAGQIDRAQVVEELAAWPYLPGPTYDEFGDSLGPVSGTFMDVLVATDLKYIDNEIYADLWRMRRQMESGSQAQ